MDAAIARFMLDLNGQKLEYAHGPQQLTAFQWPYAGGEPTARIDYAPATADNRSGFGVSGPWTLFRLIDKGKLEAIESDRFNLIFNLEGKKVILELDASSVVNPFKLAALQEFRCFDEL
jgi:type VI secretion system protein ImpL